MKDESEINGNLSSEWLSMSEASALTPYSAEYLSLLARKKKLTAKKVGKTWYTTKAILNDYMQRQMIRNQVQNGDLSSISRMVSAPAQAVQPIQEVPLAATVVSDIVADHAETPRLRTLKSDVEKHARVFKGSIPAVPVKPIPVAMPVVAKVAAPRVAPVVAVAPDAPAAIPANEKELARMSAKIEDLTSKLDSALAAANKIAKFDWTVPLAAAAASAPLVNAAPRKGTFVGRQFRTVFSSSSLAAIAVVAIVFFTIFPTPFVSAFVDKAVVAIKKSWNDANTVMGFRPGTHENEVLLLDKDGNVSIMGHIETDGQFRSYAKDGIAPIVVDSRAEVKNLNAEFVGGTKASEFTLAYVTKNGAMTTENVVFGGSVEIGKTLLVRGATRLLSSLNVDGNLSVLGDAHFNKTLTVEGPTYIKSVLNVADNIYGGKNLDLKGSISSGGSVVARSGSFSRGLSTDGKLFVGGNAEIDGNLTVNGGFHTASFSTDNLTAFNASLTNATTTNLFATNLATDNFSVVDFNFTSATGTNLYMQNLSADTFNPQNITALNATFTNSTTTNLYAILANIVTGIFNSISVDALTATNTRAVNSTTTNATTTNFYADNGAFNNLTANNLVYNGSTVVNATTTNATTTNQFVQYLIALNSTTTNATSTNGFISNLTFINATGTSATTTNLSTTNFNAANSNIGNATATNFYAQNFNAGTITYTNSSSINGTTTNSTSTNLYGSQLTFDNATGTTIYSAIGQFVTGIFNTLTSAIANITNLTATNSTTTNATTTNGSVTNLTFTNATGTSATTTNFNTTNLNAANSTTTNLFGTFGRLITGVIDTFTSTFATITNLVTTNGTTTNATSTNQFAANLTFTNATGTSATTTNFNTTNLNVANGTIVGANITRSTTTNATSTNEFVTNLAFTNATGISATTTNFNTTNFNAANSTSTNIGTTNLTATNATATNFFATNISGGSFNPSNITAINATFTSATTTNFSAVNSTTSNATTTNFFGTFGRFITGVIDTLTSTFATITNLVATNSTSTNATSTNQFAANLTFTNATGTSATTTNLSTTNFNAANGTIVGANITRSTTTNATSTNEFVTNLAFTNATGTSATTTNFNTTNLNTVNSTSTSIGVTNLTAGNSTTTNLFGTFGRFITGVIDTFTSTLATITNLIATNSTTTNATSTNQFAANLTFTNASGTSATTTNFNTNNLTFVNATGTSATTTNFFATNLTGTNISYVSSTVVSGTTTNLTFVNATGTSATTTNFNTTNLNAVNSTSTNIGATNITTTNATIGNSTTTNGFVTNLTATNATFTSATTTNLFATFGRLTTGVIDTFTSTLANITSLIAQSISVGALTATNTTAVNSTSTNATTTSGFIANLTFTNATGTSATTTNFNTTNLNAANSTVVGANITRSTTTSATSTNEFVTNLTATNATFTSATTTNFFGTFGRFITGVIDTLTSTFATITNLFATNSTTTNAVIGNLTATSSLTINATTTNATTTNAFIGNLVFTNATGTSATTTNFNTANLQTGTLSVTGNTTLGDNVVDRITVNGQFNSSLTPSSNITYDLGSPALYWRTGYFDSINVNNISAASTSIAGTNNNDFTINSDNVSNDTEDMSLIFKRGIVTPNAVIAWDSILDRFNFNQPTYIENMSGSSTIRTLEVKGSIGQTSDIFRVASSSGFSLFNVSPNGFVGVGTSSPLALLTAVGSTSISLGNGDRALRLSSIGNNTYSGLDIYSPSNPNQFFTWALAGSTTADVRFGMPTANGAFLFANDGSGAGGVTPSKLAIGLTTDAPIYFANANTVRLTIASTTGNIGIGTTSPTAKLSIHALSGDTNTSLFNIASSTLGGVSTSTLFTVLAGGNVGIGTTTPSNKLEVNGNGYFSGNLTAANITATGTLTVNSAFNGVLFATNGVVGTTSTSSLGLGSSFFQQNGNSFGTTATLGTNDANDLAFETNNSTKLTIQNSTGNLGVGISNPGQKLSVAGNIEIQENSTSTYYIGRSRLSGDVAHTRLEFDKDGGAGNYDYDMNFFTSNTGGGAATSKVTIKSGGNVGIGTSSPLGKLEIASTLGNETDLRISRLGNSAAYLGFTSVSGANTAATINVNGVNVISPMLNGGTAFGAYAGVTTAAPANGIIVSGNVGIGTTTPGAPLQIVSGGALTNIRLDNPLSTNSLDFYDNNAVNASPVQLSRIVTGNIVNHQSGFLAFSTSINGVLGEAMRIDRAGNVGIGTTTPSAINKLEVNGNGYFSGNLTGANITATGTLTVNSALNGVLFATNGVVGTTSTSSLGLGSSFFQQNGNSFGTTATLGTNDANDLAFETNNSTKLTIQNSTGNVGIGTTTPNTFLTVGDGSIAPTQPVATYKGVFVNPNSANAQIGLASSGGIQTGLLVDNGGKAYTGTWSAHPFVIRTGNSDRMTFDTAGNVGIGTTTPGGTLHIEGSTNSLVINRTTSEPNILLQSNGASDAQIRGLSAGGLHVTNGNSSVSWLDITSAGNVGIGTSSPTAKLHISDGTSARINLEKTGTSIASIYNDGSLHIQSAATGGTSYINSNTQIFTNTAQTTEYGRIDTNGNFGLGTTSASNRLEVSGNGYFSGNLTAANVTATGTLTVNSALNGVLFATNGVVGTTSTSSLGLGSSFFQQNGNSFGTTATLGTNDANDLQFETNNLTKLTIVNSTGNVGIGTTTPSSKLTISGAGGATQGIQLEDTTQTTGNRSFITQLRSTPTVGYQIAPATDLGVAQIPGLFMDRSGNVAIGTTTANFRLDVQSAAMVANIQSTTGTNSAYLRFNNNATGLVGLESSVGGSLITGGLPLAMVVDQQGAGALQLATANIARLTIDSTGNVGVGTTTPDEKLSVNGAISFRGGTASFASATSTGMLDYNAVNTGVRLLSFGSTTASRGTISFYQAGANNTTANTPLQVDSSGNVLLAQSTGNVGIGTTSPNRYGSGKTLSIAAASNYASLEMTGGGNATTSGAQIDFSSGINRQAQIFTAGEGTAGGYMGFRTTTSGGAFTENMRLDSNGNLGIGTTSPSQKLVVAGTSHLGANLLNYVSIAGSNSNPLISVVGSSTMSADLLISPLNNGQVVFGGGGWTYTTAASGKASILMNNGNSDTPNLKFAYGNNLNFGMDVSGSVLRFINQSDESGGAVIGSFTTGGNFNAVGNITAGGVGQFSGTGNSYALGNFGVGTTTPTTKLEVNGNGYFSGNLTAANITATGTLTVNSALNGVLFATNGVVGTTSTSSLGLGSSFFQQNGNSFGTTATLGTNDANDLQFETNNSTKLTIVNSTGNVGIGTTTPSGPLEVAFGSPFFSSTVVGTTGNNDPAIKLYRTTGAATFAVAALNASNGSGDFNVLTGFTASSVKGSETLTSRLTVLNGGNVGIGTTSPTSKLSVVGNVLAQDFRQRDIDGFITYNLNSTDNGAGTNGALKFRTGDATERMRLDANGNLGVGSSTPSARLSVHLLSNNASTTPIFTIASSSAAGLATTTIFTVLGNGYTGIGGISAPAALIETNGAIRADRVGVPTQYAEMDANPATGAVTFHAVSASNNWKPMNVLNSGTNVGSSAGVNDIRFGTGLVNAETIAMVIGGTNATYANNVGIGTTTPAYPLAVDRAGSASLTALSLANTQGGANDITKLLFSNGGGAGATIGYERQAAASGDLTFGTSPTFQGAIAERMRITQAGNVGIGTTTPNSLLNIYSANSANVYDFAVSNLFYNKGIKLGVDATNIPAIQGYIPTSGAATNLALNPAGGNVAIGTTTPYAQLTVAGISQQTANLTDAGLTGGTLNLVDTNVSNPAGAGGGILFSSAATSGIFPQAAIKGVLANGSARGVGSLAFSLRAAGTDTNLTEMMRIGASGSVSIGTTTATNKLDVVGSIRATNSLIVNNGTGSANADLTLIGWNAGVSNTATIRSNFNGGFVVTPSASDPTFNINTSSQGNGNTLAVNGKAVIGAGFLTTAAPTNGLIVQGNVGVGSSTPSAKLSVHGLSGDTNTALFTVASSTLNGVSTSTLFTVLANGNVGVGTTSPIEKFSVSGSQAAILVNSPTVSDARFRSITSLGDYSAGTGIGIAADVYNIYNNKTGGVPLLINSAGNIGIGTTTPSDKLDVVGSANGRVSIFSENTNTGTAAYSELGLVNDLGLVARGSVYKTSSTYAGAEGANSVNVWNAANANLTLGTSNTTRLSIAGGGAVSVTNLVSCGGIQTNAGGTMSCTSDQRLKDVQSSFTSGLAAIDKINPAIYSWKTDSGLYDGGVLYSGFIAQNVEAAIPEAISHTPTGFLQVNTTTILAATVNAIKELHLSITDLTSRVDAVEDRLATLEALVASSTLAAQTASSTASSSQTITWSNDMGASVIAFLQTVGIKLENGIATIANLVTDTFSANIAYIKDASVKSLSADALTVGSAENQSGITLYDQVSHDPYCLTIRNGNMTTASGACQSTQIVTPPPSGPTPDPFDNPTPTSTPTTTPDIGSGDTGTTTPDGSGTSTPSTGDIGGDTGTSTPDGGSTVGDTGTTTPETP